MKIQSLYFYPVKSCAPCPAEELPLEQEGPLWDRAWMIVDERGKFVTQRERPELALLQPRLDRDSLQFAGSGIQISLSPEGKLRRKVEVWGDVVEALDEGEEISRFLSDTLGQSLSLVRIYGKRLTGKEKDRSVRFPDSYPLLLCNEASLEDLNRRLNEPVDMLRFRPNIVVSGATAFAEDGWRVVRMGGAEFPVGKACTRCSIIQVDPATGKRGQEPLKALAVYRRNESGKVEFGQYLHSVGGTVLRTGMAVEAD